MKMVNLTKDNIKVGDVLYVVPRDSRYRPWQFEVGKIGRKYISDIYDKDKIVIGTSEIYRHDGIGAIQQVFLNEEEYQKYNNFETIRSNLWRNIKDSEEIFKQMDDEDFETIIKIMLKYDNKWTERKR